MQVACAVVTAISRLHNILNASGNDVIYGLKGKRNANISRFGGHKKLKPGDQKNFFQIK